MVFGELVTVETWGEQQGCGDITWKSVPEWVCRTYNPHDSIQYYRKVGVASDPCLATSQIVVQYAGNKGL